LTPTLRVHIFPELLEVRGPTGYNPEPPWMFDGWIELTCWARPGWRAICETTWDVECEMASGPEGAVHRALVRGPAIGDEVPILEVLALAITPDTHQLIELVDEEDER
jgi:hypothetical protein